jgi:hypothetical protein
VRAASLRPGDSVSVPVTLDLSAAGNHGDLGAVQFELEFPAALLQFQDATPGVAGAAQAHLAAPGRLRFAFAGTAPQGKAQLTLVTFRFRVAPTAPVGGEGALTLTYRGRLVTTGFAPLPAPAATPGTFRVVGR